MLQQQAYLIHHHDPARQPQRQAIAALLEQLGIPLTAISAQPPLQPLPPGWRGRWRVLRRCQARLRADFAQRRRRQPQRALELCLRQGWVQLKGLLELLTGSNAQLAVTWRQLQLEAIVSAKHGQAWRLALQAGAEAALVFEDDVACGPDSLQRLRQLQHALPELLNRLGADRFYVDLAGGYPLEQVVPLQRALAPVDPIEWLVSGVHTNTACAYLVSRPLLQAWQQAEQRRPGLVRLPIDHRINRASALAAADAISGHWRQPPFRHGSFCGLARSWQA